MPLESQNAFAAELAGAYANVDELASAGILTLSEASRLREVAARNQVRVPLYYASLMDTDPEKRALCPIRLQALPSLDESDPELPAWATTWSTQAFGSPVPWTADAIGDIARMEAPRLTHRYRNRAILHLSSVCAMYCRFCFRKSHLNDLEKTLYSGSLEPALNYLREHPEIREAILTGGDPLSIPDPWLDRFLDKLDAIGSLRHIRIHSRMPVTLPSRITERLAALLANRRCLVSFVAHFNHPKEFTTQARAGLALLRRAGIALYNQSVLLRGVNDDAETLGALFQSLYEDGVTPFYLHHPDWTPGTFHFRVSISRGREILGALAGRLSGPALPHYVLDMPGGYGKVSLMGKRVRKLEERHDDEISGALYEIEVPETRQKAVATPLYAEFWKN